MRVRSNERIHPCRRGELRSVGDMRVVVVTAVGMAAAALSGSAVAQVSAGVLIPAEQTAAAVVDPQWQPSRFSWGDPSLEGTYTSRDMQGIPLQRPEQFGERANLNTAEFAERATGGPCGLSAWAAQQENDGGRLELSALDSTEVGSRTFGYSSVIIEPADGRLPEFTEAELRRQQSLTPRSGNGPFHTTEDFSYYDRCISRGVTGSIFPSLYGDAMRIVQSPTEVAISYEMLHDTRIIPLDGRAPADPAIRQYMGTSVGHFEGDTLVVETTGMTDELRVARMPHGVNLKLTERFTRIDPDMIDYVVTVEDPDTYTAPWTFRLTLTTQPGYEVLEYNCHEGNFFIRTALRAEQQYQQSVAAARAAGEPIPERPRARPGAGGGLGIFAPPSAEDAVDIGSLD